MANELTVWTLLRNRAFLRVSGAGAGSSFGRSFARVMLLLFVTGVGASVLASACPAGAPAPIVDDQLRALIQVAIDDRDVTLTCGDLLRVTGLGGVGNPGFGIDSLGGLEHAVNLARLAVPRNRIADLEPLRELTGLTQLDLSANELRDIAPLRGLHALRELWLRENAISDVWPLRDLVRLERLDLRANEVADLEPLRGLERLRVLELGENRVVDVEPLAGLVALAELGLVDNEPASFEPLADLTGLRVLRAGMEVYVGEENFTPVMRLPPPGESFRFAVPAREVELDGLSGLRRLERLDLYSLAVGDAAFLAGAEELEVLTLANAELSSEGLGRLARLESLRNVNLRGNRLTGIDMLLAPGFHPNYLTLEGNCLDLRPGSPDVRVIDLLRGRGVTVHAEPQRPEDECRGI